MSAFKVGIVGARLQAHWAASSHDPAWPAMIFAEMPNAVLPADRAAQGAPDRI